MSDPCTFVIFGSTGNLAQNKLLPALYHLDTLDRLPEAMRVVGFGRRPWDSDRWKAEVRSQISTRARGGLNDRIYARFEERLHYFRGDLNDPESYRRLADALNGTGDLPENVVFYMSIRPAEYGLVARSLADVGLNQDQTGWRRLVVEKPFGYDLESAQMLDRSLHKDFDEEQIYRIDHYLGKETVQNVLEFRFANLMLEPL